MIKVESEKLKDGKKGDPEFYGLAEHVLGTLDDGGEWTSVALKRVEAVTDDGASDVDTLVALLVEHEELTSGQLITLSPWARSKAYEVIKSAKSEGAIVDVPKGRSVVYRVV